MSPDPSHDPKRLLGPGRPLSVLLFVRDLEAEESRAMVESFESLAWPAALRRSHIDLDAAGSYAEWFGVESVPAVAVIEAGMLLALEYECSPEACERALEAARLLSRRLHARAI